MNRQAKRSKVLHRQQWCSSSSEDSDSGSDNGSEPSDSMPSSASLQAAPAFIAEAGNASASADSRAQEADSSDLEAMFQHLHIHTPAVEAGLGQASTEACSHSSSAHEELKSRLREASLMDNNVPRSCKTGSTAAQAPQV